MEKQYAIKGPAKNEFWSNQYGWVEVRDGCVDTWTAEEKEIYSLPMGGIWMELEDNHV